MNDSSLPPLVPGRHLRKNSRQVLAQVAALVRKSGLEWNERPQGSAGGVGQIARATDGGLLCTVKYSFGHTEVSLEFEPVPPGAPARAVGIYTDTHPLLEGLRRALLGLGGTLAAEPAN